jgi:hypothetical protein
VAFQVTRVPVFGVAPLGLAADRPLRRPPPPLAAAEESNEPLCVVSEIDPSLAQGDRFNSW